MARKGLTKVGQRSERPVVRKPEIKVTSRGDVTQDIERIFQDGVCVDLRIGFWTAMKRNTVEDLGIEERDVPRYVIGLGTKRLVKKSLVDSWTTIANKARHRLRKRSFNFPIGSCSFAPLSELPQIEQELGDLKVEFERAVEYLWTNYDQIRDEFLAEFPEHRDSLARLFPPRDQAKRAFYFEWDIFSFSVPRKAQLVAFDKRKHAEAQRKLEEYKVRIEKRMADFLASVVTEMRTKVATACLRITERVRKGEVITDKSLNALRGVMDYYRQMNFTGDAKVEEFLQALDGVLKGRDAESFEHNPRLVGALTTALDAVQTAAESVTDVSEITGGYRRRITV